MPLFFDFLSGSATDFDLRRFVSPMEIRDLLKRKYPNENFAVGNDLLLFSTRTQHTWLMTSDRSLCCITDRRKEDTAKILWQLTKEEIVSGNRLLIHVDAKQVSENSGIISIAGKNLRKFSLDLFDPADLRRQVERMILSLGRN